MKLSNLTRLVLGIAAWW